MRESNFTKRIHPFRTQDKVFGFFQCGNVYFFQTITATHAKNFAGHTWKLKCCVADV